MRQTSFGELKELNQTGTYRRLPLTCELFSDIATSVEVLHKFMNVSDHCFMFESASETKQWGRYTFIGYDPVLEVSSTDVIEGSPKDYLSRLIAENKSPRIPGLPSFLGGLVGYFAYDYCKYEEPILDIPVEDSEGFKDFDFMLFDKLVIYDNFSQKMTLVVNIKNDNLEKRYQEGLQTLEQMKVIITRGKKKSLPKGRLLTPAKPLFDEKAYTEKVLQVKERIREGDLFQLVLSNRLEAEFSGSLFDTYRLLRTINPSPYMFYFSSKDMEVAGASPETLVKVMGSEVLTYPLAGTRRRGQNDLEDKDLEQELLADEKEKAEHNMLVDLGRNDLGKICDFGSVEVKDYLQVLRFSHVMHLGSTVQGRLRTDKEALDALGAVLPAGTLSGAPKVKACQLIAQLENNKRGIYGGAIGYLSLTGDLDTCIGIRLAYRKNGKVFVRSGAGIVADSDPHKEYVECLNKAEAMLVALTGSERMEV
ncbi:anthranilate synthase component 1 [Lachnospiraceae bacterium PM6-15]|uniref:anthranilate synthase component I family protein n=1 Tax=Ohessyouella blattaphilus TaxID=2949333 RepID=UPI003E232B76